MDAEAKVVELTRSALALAHVLAYQSAVLQGKSHCVAADAATASGADFLLKATANFQALQHQHPARLPSTATKGGVKRRPGRQDGGQDTQKVMRQVGPQSGSSVRGSDMSVPAFPASGPSAALEHSATMPGPGSETPGRATFLPLPAANSQRSALHLLKQGAPVLHISSTDSRVTIAHASPSACHLLGAIRICLGEHYISRTSHSTPCSTPRFWPRCTARRRCHVSVRGSHTGLACPGCAALHRPSHAGMRRVERAGGEWSGCTLCCMRSPPGIQAWCCHSGLASCA